MAEAKDITVKIEPVKPIKVKVISNGIPWETKVIDAETGIEIKGVCRVQFDIHGGNESGKLILTIEHFEFEYEGEAEVKREEPGIRITQSGLEYLNKLKTTEKICTCGSGRDGGHYDFCDVLR